MSTEAFFDRLMTVYGEPKHDKPEALLAEYVAALKGFSAQVLSEAAGEVIRTRKYKSWPTIGECVAAAEKVNAPTGQPVEQHDETVRRIVEAKDRSRAWARDWLKGTVTGRQSADEGWCRALHNVVWQLHHATVKRGESPSFEDVERRLSSETLAYYRKHSRARNVALERAIVLHEPLPPMSEPRPDLNRLALESIKSFNA